MMRPVRIVAACVVVVAAALACHAEEVNEARQFQLQGKQRQYFLFAPDQACEPGARVAPPLPVVVLHHGTGGNGSELVATWRELARKENVILIAPTGTGPYGWIAPQDGPELHRVLLDEVKQRCRVDERRVYIVGFSNGGDFAFYVAIAESKYFAGAAILCAALRPRQFAMLDLAPRKLPLFYMVAERDTAYPLSEAEATRRALAQRKWPFRYRLLQGQSHGYDPAFTTEAWEFLRPQKLDAPPEFAPLNAQWLGFALR